MKTLAPYNITQTTAIVGGYDISGIIASKGIVWDTVSIPTTIDLTTTTTKDFITGTNTTNYILQMTGLTPNTKYYVRAFTTGTANTFGKEFSFVTKSVTDDSTEECTIKEVEIKPGQVYTIPPNYVLVGMEATAEQAEKLKSKCEDLQMIIEELRGE